MRLAHPEHQARTHDCFEPHTALWILTGLATTMFLRAAAELLIPIVIAVLVSYALEPIVARLDRLRVPRLLGAAVLLLAVVGAAGWGVYALRADIKDVVTAVPDATRRAAEWLGLRQSAVQAQQAVQSPELVQWGVSWLMSAAGHLTVIVFLAYFLLISGEHFLLVRAVTSVIVGVATWGALLLMGVQQAAVWGILAGVFNSIPYFGPVIVSGGLLVVGFVQFGDPVTALKISGIALAITSLEGWLLDPPLLGKAERMHVLVVFLGVLLWTWLWGAWGTILAVPMLVVVKSICDRVEPLQPIGRLLAP